MGHNLHFLVVEAEDADDAADTASTFLNTWGSDDNWHQIVGAVALSDARITTPNELLVDRWSVPWFLAHAGDTVLDKMRNMILEDINGKKEPYRERAHDSIRTILAEGDAVDPRILWSASRSLREYAVRLGAFAEEGLKNPASQQLFNYREYEFDQFGVTVHGMAQENYNPDNTYVVLVDMHS